MKFPAKIILFGEYGILLKSKALAIPYSRYSGVLTLPAGLIEAETEWARVSNLELRKFLNYTRLNINKFRFLDLSRMEEEVDRGLYFDSSIPSGSGLGSSGALTAALFYRFALNPTDAAPEEIQGNMAVMESKFHGVSSGIDPLTSYLNKPVLLEGGTLKDSPVDLTYFFYNYHLFLIDSESRGNTRDLVELFRNQYLDPRFREKIDTEYIPLIDLTIDNLIKSNLCSFDVNILKYSQFQLTNLAKMIPDFMRKHFEHGIVTGDFYLKLCGSGGGGFLIALSRNRVSAENYFKMNHLSYHSYTYKSS